MDKYICSICGYIYEPEKGETEGSILAGTAFKDIPDEWECPLCGVGKDHFTPLEKNV